MDRRFLVLGIVTSCLIVILIGGAGAWGIQQGLIQAPIGIARIGNLELMAFSGVQYSTMRPPRGYYVVWVALRRDTRTRPRTWQPLLWARQLVRLEVPPSAVLRR